MSRPLTWLCALIGFTALPCYPRLTSMAQKSDLVNVELQRVPFEDARRSCGPHRYLLTLRSQDDIARAEELVKKKQRPSPSEGVTTSTAGLPDAIWLNMKVIGGFYHWLDPVPRLVIHTHAQAYSIDMATWNITHECAIYDLQTRKIVTKRCDEKFSFVCVRWTFPPSLNKTIIVWLKPTRSPILLSWQMRDLVLSCHARFVNGPPVYLDELSLSYVWTKNGIYLDDDQAAIKPDIVSEINVVTHSNESSQGHFRCGVKLLPSGQTFWSNEVTVVLRDFYTRRVTLTIPTLLFGAQPWNIIGSSFAVNANLSRILEQLPLHKRYLPFLANTSDVPSQLRWSFFRADPGSPDGSLLNISAFVYVKQEPNAETGLDLRLPAQLRDFAGLTIHDVVHCPPEKGPRLQWTNYDHISLESSLPMCLTGRGELITRQCLINFTSEARWAPFDESRCDHLHQDPVEGQQEIRAVCKSEKPCLAGMSSGLLTWKKARKNCRDWNAYLPHPSVLVEKNIHGWSALTRKFGYVQSESTADDEVLPALSRSEVFAPYVLSSKMRSRDTCFTVDLQRNRTAQYSCHMRLKSPCALPYRKGFLSLPSCPSGLGWLDLEHKARCLWLNYTKVSQDEAFSICESRGGRLLTFKGKHTYDTITGILVRPEVPEELDTFWIGLTKPDSGGKLKHSNWDPSTDYNKTGMTLRVNRYVAYKPLEVKWSTAQPWMRYPFICESPLVAGSPWLRVQIERTGEAVTLTCHTSPGVLEGSVMWFKDGLAVRGNRIEPDPAWRTLTIPSATKNSPYLQGYYWCEGISVHGLKEVESRKKLLRIPDLETYTGTVEVTKTASTPDLSDLSSESFINFATRFRKLLTESEAMRDVGSYRLSDVMVLRLTMLRYNTHQVRFAMFLTEPKVGIKLKARTSARPIRRRDLTAAADTDMEVTARLRDALTRFNGSTVMEFNLSSETAQVFSTRLCYASATNHSTGLHSTLHWPATEVGNVATSLQACINDDRKPVVRRCEGNYTVGAFWGQVQGSCTVPPSQRTLDLMKLSKVLVTNNNVLDTVVQLKTLTADSNKLLPQDVSYAAVTLENAGSVQKISEQVATNMLSSINHIVNASATSLSLSRAANSTNKIISSMEQTAANLEDHIVVFNGSAVLGKIRARQHWSGIYLNTVEQQWHNFSDELTETADVAIMFPQNNPCITGAKETNLTLGLITHNALFGNYSNITNEACTDVLLVQYERCKVDNTDEHFSFYFKSKCANRTSESELAVQCVFWDTEADDKMGAWSFEGCVYVGMVGPHHVCNCSHLTSFGILFKLKDDPHESTVHDDILSFLTLIGVALSIVGLLLVIATYILFEKWRKGVGHKCLLHLSVALLGSLLLFGVSVIFHGVLRSPVACAAMGALLHYLLLVTFSWTFVEAILQYLRFVKVLGTYIPHFVLKCALPAWGIPFIVVAVTVSLDAQHYSSRKQLCWPHKSSLLYGFVLPVGLTLLANVAVFSIVIYNIYFRRQKSLRSNQSQVKLAKAQLRATILIVFLLGLTWIFAYLSIIDAYGISRVFEYLFVISATLQGFVIFLFHVAYEKAARKMWKSKFVYWIPQGVGDIKGRRLHSEEGSSLTAQKTTST